MSQVGMVRPGHTNLADDRIVGDAANRHYVETLFNHLMTSKKQLAPYQLHKALMIATLSPDQQRLLQNVGPFLVDFDYRVMIDTIKHVMMSRDKVYAVECLAKYLPPTTTLKEKELIIDAFPFNGEKMQARAALDARH